MMLKNILEEILEKKQWVKDVKVKWHPPKGTFAKDADPEKSAEIICKGHDGDLKSSIAALNFFKNREGVCDEKSSHYDPEWCKKLNQIEKNLEKMCKNS